MTPSKKNKSGLKGIVSALAFSPDYSGVFAAASYATSPSSFITLFSEETLSPVMSLGDVTKGGVTQVLFNPTNPNILYSTSRRSRCIQSWDLRNPLHILRTFKRDEDTNQRLRFDVDLGGTWLCTGDEQGKISIFDQHRETECTEPDRQFQAHNDAIGSVAFHPTESWILSVSGSRHFASDAGHESDSDTSDDSPSEEDMTIDAGKGAGNPVNPRPKIYALDSSMRLWRAGESGSLAH
jgi:WD40 repeat protein